jgi:hypothetical protein
VSQISAERTRWAPTSDRPFVVIQQATEAGTPTNPADAAPRLIPIDQPILESLVIPLAMVVLDELREGPSEVPLAQGHHPI